MNITVRTRALNLKLYKRMLRFIPDSVECIGHTDYSEWIHAVTFLHDAIDATKDVLIVLDEDAYVEDWDAIERLCKYVKENNFTHAGVPDGGSIWHRTHSYVHMNPFFVVFNCSLFKAQKIVAGRTNIDSTNFEQNMTRFKPAFLNTSYEHDNSEPFAGLFYWLAKIGKPLYLQSRQMTDNIGTIVFDHVGNEICSHCWYSRLYETSPETKARIDRIYRRTRSKYKVKGIAGNQ